MTDASRVKELALEVVRDSYLFSLGTIDEKGPWQSYLFFVADDDFAIYWLSHTATRHSKALEADPRTSAVFLACDTKDAERALQMEGVSERISAPSAKVQVAYSKKRTPEGVYDFTAVLDKGYVWYRFTPTYIGLIHSEAFGKNRQQVL